MMEKVNVNVLKFVPVLFGRFDNSPCMSELLEKQLHTRSLKHARLWN